MQKIGYSKDIHNKIFGKKIYLGGLEFECNFNVNAYSDGDVILHAVCESILGALSLGDLGEYFNSTNQQPNFRSTLMVDFVNNKLKEYKSKIINIDVMIVLDGFIISKIKEKIKINLANLFKINKDNIAIKATTTENNFNSIVECNSVVLIENKVLK